MINLPVSEAFAYDYLAILAVKHDQGLGSLSVFGEICDKIAAQCPEHPAVIRSKEYSDCYVANREVWTMVAKAAKDECKASEVDQANQRRYAAKKALQERFWPDKPLAEVKAERP